MKSTTKKVAFEVKEDVSIYVPSMSTIRGNTSYMSNSIFLRHEIFHVFQHQLYGNFMLETGAYTVKEEIDGKMVDVKYYDPGVSNIEFEQIVFNDLTRYKAGTYSPTSEWAADPGIPGSSTALEKYLSFMRTLADRSDINTYIQSDAFINEYFDRLKDWVQYTRRAYKNSEILPNFKPEALKQLLKDGICN